MFKLINIAILLFATQQFERHGVEAVLAPERLGCYHNGTIFADGSLVPSMEPCLSCKCSEKTLICSLRICPEMPVPPPRGCVLVQKKNSCCPYLSCSRYHLPYDGLNRRIIAVLDQYERESIDRVVSENVLQRRSDDSDDGSGEICVHNGTVYKSGSAMSSSTLCTYCFCIGGTQKCVKPKCMIKMDGCKPIFVDSTCCPVRYDCTTKTSGVVKSQNHIRRSGNKHYQRMAARIQRSRGCTQGSNFYPEGHKMPSDPGKPCDVCFCIRGSKQCTPKKCAPALRNCIPVVPKGQCCPSSYECGPAYDIGRGVQSQPRQFDLFSIIFGADSEDNATTTIGPATEVPEVTVNATSEKSFFEKIREGLEFIDNNDSVVGDLIGAPTNKAENVTETTTSTTVAPEKEEGEEEEEEEEEEEDFSFLDLLLGNLNKSPEEAATNESEPQTTTTEAALNVTEIFGNFGEITLGDLLVGNGETTPTPPTERALDEIVTPVPNEETDQVTEVTSTEKPERETTQTTEPSTIATGEPKEKESTTTTTGEQLVTDNESNAASINEEADASTVSEVAEMLPPVAEALVAVKEEESHDSEQSTTAKMEEEEVITTTTEPTVHETTTIDVDPSMKESDTAAKVVVKRNDSLSEDHMTTASEIDEIKQSVSSSSKPFTTDKVTIEKPQNDFLSALITGLSNIFASDESDDIEDHRNESQVQQHKNESEIAVEKLNITEIDTTIDKSNVAEMVKPKPPMKIVTVSTTAAPSTVKSIKEGLIERAKPQIIPIHTLAQSPLEKPLMVKKNPPIPEQDFNFDYNEPTLPPSLPNLKIIPFLPADAVKTDRKQVFDYYKVTPPHYPSITEKHDNWGVNPKGKSPNPKPDYVVYDHTRYPSITESYDRPTNYPPKYVSIDPSGHKKFVYTDYEYDEFGIPDIHGIRKNDKFVGDIKYIPSKYEPELKNYGPAKTRPFIRPGIQKFATAFTEKNPFPYPTTEAYDFKANVNRFSPPTKTEGGFVPKTPIKDYYYDNIFTTKFLPDLTTNTPATKPNATKVVIEITTPDPFKDVIKTEPPPDLYSLIEDKEKLIANGVAPDVYVSVVDENNHEYDKEIISITTDASYNYTSEYQDAVNYKPAGFNRTHHSNTTDSPTVPVTVVLNSSVNYNSPETHSQPPQESGQHFDPSVLGEHSEEKNDFGSGLDGFLDFLLQDEIPEKTTVPPFRTLPPSQNPISPEAFTVIGHETSSLPQHGIIEETTISPDRENLGILREILLTTFEPPDSNRFQFSTESTTPSMTTTTISHYPHSPNHHLAKPFNQLPYLDSSININPQGEANRHENHHYSSLASDLNLLLPVSHQDQSQENFHINHRPSIAPVSQVGVIHTADLEQHQGGGAEILTKPPVPPNIQDPAGILKLAGCNIYGRMYRVGRIISELSGPCLECKCTEIGVSCNPLKC